MGNFFTRSIYSSVEDRAVVTRLYRYGALEALGKKSAFDLSAASKFPGLSRFHQELTDRN